MNSALIPQTISSWSVSAGVSATVTGATIAWTGSGTTTVSVNNIFVGSTNFLLVGYVHGAADYVGIRLRNNTTDESGSNYRTQYWFVDGASRSAGNTDLTFGYFGFTRAAGNNTQGAVRCTLFGPNVAQRTLILSQQTDPYNTLTLIDTSCSHNQATAYNGFTLMGYGATPTFSGRITVYRLGE